MGVTLVNQISNIQVPKQDTALKASTAPAPAAPETPGLSKDSVNLAQIKQGFTPSLKGFGAGALTGGVAVGVGTTLLLNGSSWAPVIGMFTGLGGAAAGGVAGALVANTTDSPWKGALLGGASGAVVGAAAFSLMAGDFGNALSGAAIGGIAGLVGGLTSSFLTERQ